MTNAPLIMKPGKLYAVSDGEVLTFECHHALFLALSAKVGTVGCAGIFTLLQLKDSINDLLITAAQLLSCDQKDLTAKIIGRSDFLMQAKSVLESRKISLTAAKDTGKKDSKGFFYPAQNRLRLAVDELSVAPPVATPKKLRIGIVDDSKTIRTLLKNILSSDASLSVVWEASTPSEALQHIASNPPDVITLDIHMPEMNGVDLLRRFIPKQPIPTIIITSLSMEEGPLVLDALECGAIDYVQKPSASDLGDVALVIIEKIKAISSAKFVVAKASPVAPRLRTAQAFDRDLLIAIGSSTGGTEALKVLLTNLPAEIPPILIVQHIPPVFSLAFAKRLNELCAFEVKEAVDGDEVRPGRVLVAPGGFQMKLRKSLSGLIVSVDDDAPVNRHKPSVDVLFESVAREVGAKAIGVILTGMGNDGAKGLLSMRKSGARTAAQDESTCVVYGMPREAVKMGAVEKVARLDELAEVIVNWFEKAKAAPKSRASA